MKLYTENYPAPNPRKVHIYLAEKGIDNVERVHTKMGAGMHKAPDFVAKNSLGQVPTLETDDGRFISESVAICRYFESLYPEPPLFGRDPYEQAMVEMWIRRAEFRLWNPIGQVWINSDPRTASVMRKQFADYGEQNKLAAQSAMKWLDRELAESGGPYLVGDYFSMADIVLLCGIDFGKFIHQEMPEGATHLRAWHERVTARPTSRAQGVVGAGNAL